MPGVKFVIEADAAQGVQELLRLRAAEKKVGDGFKEMALDSKAAGAQMQQDAQRTLREMDAMTRQSRMNITGVNAGRYFSNHAPGAGNFFAMSSLLQRGNAMLAPGRAADDRAFTAFIAERNAAAAANSEFMRQNNLNAGLGRDISQARNAQIFNAGAMGLTMSALAMAGLQEVTESYTQRLNEAAAAGVQFEKDIQPLISLGDNAKSGSLIRAEILAQSGAHGMDTKAIADARFMLQSAASNLGPKMQNDIFNAGMALQGVDGGDLEPKMVALTKLMQTYGQELGTADMGASKLQATEDKAAITMNEISQLLPDILEPAKMMGITYDQIAASVITATQVMGNNEKTMTGLRNMFLKMNEAQQKGLIYSGDYLDNMKQLANVAAPELAKVFGDRTVGVVAALTDHIGDLTKNLEEMGDVKPGDVMTKYLHAQQAPSRRNADTIGSLDQIAKTVPMSSFVYDDDDVADKAMRLKAAEVGVAIGLAKNPIVGPFIKPWMLEPAAALAAAQSADIAQDVADNGGKKAYGWGYANQDFLQMGISKLISDETGAAMKGDKTAAFQAAVHTLQFGLDYGTIIGGRITGKAEANEYVALDNKIGADIGLGAYTTYRQDELKGDTAAMAKDIEAMKATAKASADAAEAAAKGAKAAADQMGDSVKVFSGAVDKFAGAVGARPKPRNGNTE